MGWILFQRAAAAPDAITAAGEEPLRAMRSPAIVRVQLPENAMRLARGLMERFGETNPPNFQAFVSAPTNEMSQASLGCGNKRQLRFSLHPFHHLRMTRQAPA